MSDKSPLFISSLELLAHSTELYSTEQKRKYKFVILHLANAIELILKDIMIDKEISIYKNRSTETVSIWTAFEELSNKGLTFPERPIIELLVDDRNTIQHRFGYPDAESVFYYLDCVIHFFTRILEEHYSVKITEALGQHLSKNHMQLLGLVENELVVLDSLYKISPGSSVIKAHEYILDEFARSMDTFIDEGSKEQQKVYKYLLFFLTILGDAAYIEDPIGKYQNLREMRNIAAHSGDNEDEDKSYKNALDNAKALITAINKAEHDEYLSNERIASLILKYKGLN